MRDLLVSRQLTVSINRTALPESRSRRIIPVVMLSVTRMASFVIVKAKIRVESDGVRRERRAEEEEERDCYHTLMLDSS